MKGGAPGVLEKGCAPGVLEKGGTPGVLCCQLLFV